MGDPQSGSDSPVPVEAKKESTAIMSRLTPRSGDQSHQDNLRPKCGAKLSCPGDVQVGNRVTMSHCCQVEKSHKVEKRPM